MSVVVDELKVGVVDEMKVSMSIVDKMKVSVSIVNEMKVSVSIIDEINVSMSIVDGLKVDVVNEMKAKVNIVNEMKMSMSVVDEIKVRVNVVDEMKTFLLKEKTSRSMIRLSELNNIRFFENVIETKEGLQNIKIEVIYGICQVLDDSEKKYSARLKIVGRLISNLISHLIDIYGIIPDRPKLCQDDNDKLVKALVKFLILDAQPISLVVSSNLHEFIKELDPMFSFPDEKRYLGVTCSWLDSDFKIHEVLLSLTYVRYPHTANVIQEKLEEVIEK
ncbi:8803_t:CDS:2 [Cetraspora pellucida]|uniref:8803_t:CDS:1 n=1 Tax=Cetraspora pellucida TaxID=1433469 RepID=A0ACA9LXY6_9GLOM|nr:8803_t:CDS:2 [Cetraspora pellucida]